MPAPRSKIKDIADAVKGADKLILATDPDREGEAISWHILEVLQAEEGAGQDAGRAGGVQRRHQIGGAGRHRPSPPDQRGTGGRLSGAPRAGLSGRASRCRRCCGANCRARARPAACNRWRCAWSCERENEIEAFRAQEYWSIDADLRAPERRVYRAPDPAGRQEARKAVAGERSRRRRAPSTRSRRRRFSIGSVESQAGQAQSLPRPSSPRPCSRKPRASWASTPSAPCRSRRAFMKAWISAAKPSA